MTVWELCGEGGGPAALLAALGQAWLSALAASCRSMTAFRFSKGTAPTTFSPFTTRVGVPPMPRAVAWASSAAMRWVLRPEAMDALKRPTSRPSSLAHRS